MEANLIETKELIIMNGLTVVFSVDDLLLHLFELFEDVSGLAVPPGDVPLCQVLPGNPVACVFACVLALEEEPCRVRRMLAKRTRIGWEVLYNNHPGFKGKKGTALANPGNEHNSSSYLLHILAHYW